MVIEEKKCQKIQLFLQVGEVITSDLGLELKDTTIVTSQVEQNK